ncbi:MAG TPA: hypothetical protein VFE97_26565 [Methylomirabilota bacterium]|nr:hypothetical protein [Methylomirabilota bacterium]
MIAQRDVTTVLCAVLVWASTSCRERDRSNPTARTGADHGTVVRDSGSSLAQVATVPTAEVEQWKGPGDRPFEVTLRTADPASALARKFGTITRTTSLRTRAADLGQYPCTSCHLGRRMVLADDRITDAHQNIESVHPAQTGAVCSTCHAPDNVELLTLKTGDRATLDHAYRLCAQCHFSQAESWAGGAHGKRLDGWQGRRVVMGCADCHDPHKPVMDPRVPFRAPQLERTRGGGQ